MVSQELDRSEIEGDRIQRRARPGLYVTVVLAALVAAFAFHMREAGIFSCPARDYGENRYLGYCNGTAYGDYDHGALWFGLEPGVREAAAAADVLFVGNSRMQFALSAPPLGRWFAEHGFSYYLLGFTHNENAIFTTPLLESLAPRARAYVVSVDKFFFDRITLPADDIMHSPDARGRYQGKQAWQAAHRRLCGALPALCGETVSYYRQRDTGEFRLAGTRGLTAAPIEVDRPVYVKGNPELLATVTANARDFLAGLGVDPGCVVLTYIPSVENNRLLADALADALGMELIAPQGEGLNTIDGSHLDRDSAQIFAGAFMQAAGPRLQRCLDGKLAHAAAGAAAP